MTSQQPSVAVVIPAYNVAACLGACLDSVRAQTHRPASVVVVDDGSTDGTAELLRLRGAEIRVVTQANLGQGAARNAGVALTSAPYVAFLDADDAWEPEFLAATVAFMEAHPDAVAVSTAGRVHAGRGRSWTVPNGVEAQTGGAGEMLSGFFQYWADHDHVRTGTVLMRSAVLRQAGGQREDLRISQDLEYWGYLATFGPWGFIPRVLWNGHSREAARAGWRAKYAARRRLCPNVSQWEARIVPRLTPGQAQPFARVRGRVAAGYIHAKILGGDSAGARELFQTYATSLPRNRVTTLLRASAPLGSVGWALTTVLLRAREALK